MGENITKTISQMLQEIADDICDNYCKYRDTADEECLCDLIRKCFKISGSKESDRTMDMRIYAKT